MQSIHQLLVLRTLYALCGCALLGCGPANIEYVEARGMTMGTAFSVKAHCPRVAQINLSGINEQLEWVNNVMSTYRSDSTLSRFNSAAVGQWYAVEPELIFVLEAAFKLSAESEGAFDVTVGPLVNLWGFGPQETTGNKPTRAEVELTLERVGAQYLELQRTPAQLYKQREIYIDLSAIAKGFGVDYVADYLTRNGCSSYLVEIGGEVRGMGLSPKAQPWKIGIEVPQASDFAAIVRVIELSDAAAATSGDYRNFIEWEGQKYSHTIDPRTGYPVQHTLASVTVIHQSTMLADGLATLLNVLGPDAGFDYARNNNLAVLFITRNEKGFLELSTPEFKQYLAK